jgi:hypothetical protein
MTDLKRSVNLRNKFLLWNALQLFEISKKQFAKTHLIEIGNFFNFISFHMPLRANTTYCQLRQ